MKVNFDGMRRNATREMNTLANVLDDIIGDGDIPEHQAERIKKQFNNSAQSVDMFNCLSVDTDENFNELDIDITRFELDE